MSLVTRCPACGTAFKVVRDQLRISDGWVRCGRCSEVFDAMPGLTETAGDADGAEGAPAEDLSPSPASQQADPAPGDATASEPPAAPQPMPSPWPDARLLDFSTSAPAAAPAGIAPPLPTEFPSSMDDDVGPDKATSWFSRPDLPVIVADEPWPELPALPVQAPAPGRSEAPSPVDEAVDAQLQKALRRARIQALREARRRERAQAGEEGGAPIAPAQAPAAAPVDERADPGLPDAVAVAALREASSDIAVPVAAPAVAPAPSFFDAPLPAADTPAKPARGKAALWGTAVVLAALALVFQVLRHERETLAAGQPGWQPLLAAVCALSGCEIGPLRRIDAVHIEGSGFTPRRNAPGYRLDFTLRSASAQPLRMPSVELTLLDSSERPVVRRVLHPQDMGASATLGPHAEQAVSLPMTLQPPAGAALPAVIGYRLVLFYP